jgi:hypothetical protein
LFLQVRDVYKKKGRRRATTFWVECSSHSEGTSNEEERFRLAGLGTIHCHNHYR